MAGHAGEDAESSHTERSPLACTIPTVKRMRAMTNPGENMRECIILLKATARQEIGDRNGFPCLTACVFDTEEVR
jgi:hypothetical protein